MYRLLNQLKGYAVESEGEQIGFYDDFYLDTENWKVRYLVVNAADWLDGRFVYLSTIAVGTPDEHRQAIPVKVSKEIIRNSPDIGAGKMITRSMESELHNYFQWPYYWKPGDEGGLGPGNLAAIPLIELAADVDEKLREAGNGEQAGQRLISLDELTGFNLQARDGSTGSISDLLINDEGWNILYLVADPGGRKVLLAPNWVQAVDWLESKIQIDLDSETIRNSPEYDPDLPFDLEMETRLREHYRR